jgi:hypothetical protein
MAGELWRQITQIGREVTPGTPVAATRRTYWRDISFTKEREPRYHEFATGTRDAVRSFTSGAVEAGGSISLPVSADELLELLLLSVNGTVTPTTPPSATNARLWTFKPGTDLASATIERNDGANLQRLLGARGNELKISGSVADENTASLELFATDREDDWPGPLTPALPERTPDLLEGWQANFYLDAFSSPPGTTQVPCALINWELTIGNNMGRKYCARNSKAASAITFGLIEVSATLLLEASSPETVAQLARWNADEKLIARLEFIGPADGIETGFSRFVTFDLPGAWGSPDTNQEDSGTRGYSFPISYVYDPALGAGVQIRLQNARTTAF